MRIFQITVRKLLGLLVLAEGVLLIFYGFDQLYRRSIEIIPSSDYFRLAVAVLLIFIGLVVVLPLFPQRRKKVISFPGTHGRVDIRLDAVESSLHRVTGKMREVKKVNLTLTPIEDNRSVRIKAGLSIFKSSDEDVRELTERIQDKIRTTAANILGIEDIEVNVSIQNIIVEPPSKTSPRKGETGPTAVPLARVHPERVPVETEDIKQAEEEYGVLGLPGNPLRTPVEGADEEQGKTLSDQEDVEKGF
jgi:uncharacterized alkaline shock family protein YloU